ncbi:LD-carboxypeptidase [Verticiella sediminum]|uniref:LD-carboxypeptidase n=1 Tax=Verticiella sediminum TaxID=1247510 RepID=A0A556AZU1_9BURK|nr:LD-carboxypeptidase [Verticiella sediminum]TSH97985.1 LD-carboxypeptidase [Verticiella sediminum]
MPYSVDHDHPHDHAHAHDHPPAKGRRKREGIYLISPAGAVLEPDSVALARERLKAYGYSTVLDRAALARQQRFAGTDEQRLAAFERAAAQRHDIVMAVRGGYGMTRLLHRIDWHRMADSGKRFVGHSDLTAFQLALYAQTGTVSYAGPMARYDFGGKKLDELTAEMFCEVMRGELEVVSFESPDSDPVDARGVLWGGNLALVTALLGTPYLPKVRGGILFLEDINEAPYRIERMLIQLLQAGVLARQKAIVLGRFTGYRTTDLDGGYDLADVIAWIRRESGVPVITGLPFGHVPTKVTLPVGAKVGVATEGGMAYLVLQEHSH